MFSSPYLLLPRFPWSDYLFVLCCVRHSATPSMACSPPGFSVYGDSPGKNTGVACHALLLGIFPIQGSYWGLPHCGRILFFFFNFIYFFNCSGFCHTVKWISHGFTCRADSLPYELPGKTMNTRMGSLSLLQVIFWIQESNKGLRHCRQILYQLSYRSPITCLPAIYQSVSRAGT